VFSDVVQKQAVGWFAEMVPVYLLYYLPIDHSQQQPLEAQIRLIMFAA
jgi:hypothetical protein